MMVENKEKISFNETDSILIKEALDDFLVNLKINNGSKKRIQEMQQILDKLPTVDKNWVVNAK